MRADREVGGADEMRSQSVKGSCLTSSETLFSRALGFHAPASSGRHRAPCAALAPMPSSSQSPALKLRRQNSIPRDETWGTMRQEQKEKDCSQVRAQQGKPDH